MKEAEHNSKRSKRRRNRGWKGLELSSRKHRRALRRSMQSRTQYGKLGNPGDKMQASGDTGSFVHIAGGSIKFW